MSDSDSPRCQSRIVSSSRSRPGLRPATISPSSACSVASDSLPASTCARRLPNCPALHWPQSSTTILSMMSVSESSTALIVPYGTTNAPRLIHSVRSSGSGCCEPRRLDDDVGAAHARLPVVGRDDGLAEVVRRAARRTRRGSPAGASARGSRRSRTGGRAGARSSTPCRARRCGRARGCPCARGASRRAPSPRRCACR